MPTSVPSTKKSTPVIVEPSTVADACNVAASPTVIVDPTAGDVTVTTGVVGSSGVGGTTTPPSMPIARASITSVAPSEKVTVRGAES